MPVPGQDCAHSWLRFIYNHNPFYVVSAALVLYGLHVSFRDNLNPTDGWRFTQLLMGYILLLAATGVLVVRLGQVWEDARTLILLVALLMVALASSFDRVCLDNEYQGARFLACGLAFSLVLSELLLRVLRLRFPLPYRMAFYSLLALLFAYPAWLGHLSLEDRVDAMAWYVMGFPTFAGLMFAMLAPAARRRGRDVLNNGTPWGWPLYPWSLFVLLGVGVVLRAYAMSMAFDPTKGDASGFQLYFLVPFVLSWILLWFEGSDQSKSESRFLAAILPLMLLVMALPGASASASQARYLELLQAAIGSPIQITAALLIAYYTYLWLRGNRSAELGLLAALGVLAMVDERTVNIDTLAPFNIVPIVAAAALLAFCSWRYKNSIRLAVSAVLCVGCASLVWQHTTFLAFRGYLPIHVLVVTFAALGLLYHDWLGRSIARAAAVVLSAAALLAFVGYRFVFPGVPATVHGIAAGIFAALAAAYWVKNRRFDDLQATVVCLAVSALLFAEHFIGRGWNYLILQGKQWIAWGAVSFLIGLLISLAKGGQIRPIRRALMRLHLAILGRDI
jgi:hypothetical protein